MHRIHLQMFVFPHCKFHTWSLILTCIVQHSVCTHIDTGCFRDLFFRLSSATHKIVDDDVHMCTLSWYANDKFFISMISRVCDTFSPIWEFTLRLLEPLSSGDHDYGEKIIKNWACAVREVRTVIQCMQLTIKRGEWVVWG
jgi:hypothetical protein